MISLAVVQEKLDRINAWHVSKGELKSENSTRYLRCLKFSASTADFAPAIPDEAQTGSTNLGVVVPGAWK